MKSLANYPTKNIMHSFKSNVVSEPCKKLSTACTHANHDFINNYTLYTTTIYFISKQKSMFFLHKPVYNHGRKPVSKKKYFLQYFGTLSNQIHPSNHSLKIKHEIIQYFIPALVRSIRIQCEFNTTQSNPPHSSLVETFI